MLQSHWFVLVALAAVSMGAWLFIPVRIATTSLLASGLWLFAAYTGGDLTQLTDSGTEVAVSAPELQYVALAMGLLSLLARVLYWFDEYPPNEQSAAGEPADSADTQPTRT
jgi:hypothetical protein